MAQFLGMTTIVIVCATMILGACVSPLPDTLTQQQADNPGSPSILSTAVAINQVEQATQTAWASITPETGAPTEPAPRPDGLDLSDSSSWARYDDPTGITYEHLVGSTVTIAEPTVVAPEAGGGAMVSSSDEQDTTGPAAESVWVSTFRGDNEVITDPAFPYIEIDPQQEAYWPIQVEIEGADIGWLYVLGDRNSEPNPANTTFWNRGPTLYSRLYNSRCMLSITFSSSLGGPGPVEDMLASPLDQVVAEHFPVFDHMYRSVRFPPECHN